jgi:hypothetical protein
VSTALPLLLSLATILAGQAPLSKHEQADDAKALVAFSSRVADYMKLRAAVEKSLPALTETDLPELIAAHQVEMAAKLRAVRPRAKAGDVSVH